VHHGRSGGQMTRLEWINFFIVQWFFFRICRVLEGEKQIGWGVMFPIVPLTGWDKVEYFPGDYAVLEITPKLRFVKDDLI
jgi:hypothetical protein